MAFIDCSACADRYRRHWAGVVLTILLSPFLLLWTALTALGRLFQPRRRQPRLCLLTGSRPLRRDKAIVGRWFTEFWGETCNLGVVDELAAPDMLLHYSLHAPRRGHADVKAFMSAFREPFPDLNFWGVADLIAERDYVVGRWDGGGTHTGPAFSDFLIGSLPPASGRKMRFTGTTVLRITDGKIAEEIGLDDGVTALQQLGLIRTV